MKSFIRDLTPRGEAVLVLLICFGLGVIGLKVVQLLTPGFPHGRSAFYGLFSNIGQIGVGVYELSVFALVFLYIGRIRGWSVARFGFQISWKWTGLGVLLFIAVELIFVLGSIIAFLVAFHFRPGGGHAAAGTARLVSGHIALPVIIVISIMNGIFEELMEVSYVFKATEKYGMWSAVFASALIRTVLHIHLGPVAMVCILALGVTFGLIYWKWRQLWPLIVAHSLMDFVGLLYLSHHATQ